MEYDCIIVGAGCAGMTLARLLHNQGLKIMVLEKDPQIHWGHPYEVAVGLEALKNMVDLSQLKPLENPRTSRYFIDDPEDYLILRNTYDDGAFVRHSDLVQGLFASHQCLSLVVRFSHEVHEALIEDGYLVGLRGTRKSLFGTKSFEYRTKLVVDASGMESVIRKKTPKEFRVKHGIRKQDFAFAWMEAREVSDKEKKQLKEKWKLSEGMELTRIGSSRNQWVMHLRSDNTLRLFVTMGIHKTMDRNSVPTTIEKYRGSHALPGKRIYSGSGFVPIRRALDSMVGNGFVCLGDAACQVIPTMGAGISASLRGAEILAESLVPAYEAGDFSKKQLWHYNYSYHSDYGAVMAAYDIVRRFLQSIPHEEFKSIFSKKLVSAENYIRTFTSYTIKYSMKDILDHLNVLLRHPGLMKLGVRMLQALKDSQKAARLYQNYPAEFTENSLGQWLRKCNALFSAYRTFKAPEEESFL